MNINQILDKLVCTQCKGSLESQLAQHQAVCNNCQLTFPIVDGVTNMLINKSQEDIHE